MQLQDLIFDILTPRRQLTAAAGCHVQRRYDMTGSAQKPLVMNTSHGPKGTPQVKEHGAFQDSKTRKSNQNILGQCFHKLNQGLQTIGFWTLKLLTQNPMATPSCHRIWQG